jgi:hypothetical protein
MIASGIPVFYAFQPDVTISYRNMTFDEAYWLIRKSSTPDEDYQNELFDETLFFRHLVEEYPISVITDPLLYQKLEQHRNVYTDILNHWNYERNPVRALVYTVASVIRIMS